MTQPATPIDFVEGLFSGERQIEAFQKKGELFPARRLTPSPNPRPFPKGEAISLPTSYVHEGEEKDSAEFIESTDTMALFVLKDGRIRHEYYAEWGEPDTPWISASVGKSFVSVLVGIAIDEGLIGSVEDPITDYLTQFDFEDSAFYRVRIKDILQMSSGSRWNEDYSDPDADVMRLLATQAGVGTMEDLLLSLRREREPGTFNRYNSAETQILGMLVAKVTGRTLTDYMQEKLWDPLGMEMECRWLIDGEGMEMAYGGLNAVARDYAKLGELFRLKGNWHGKQIVSQAWVEASVTPDAPHLLPGWHDKADSPFGYGYQWWVFDGDEGEYAAIGVYNQFVYVNPTHDVAIVKLSANPIYGQTNDQSSYREEETVSFLRAFVAALSN